MKLPTEVMDWLGFAATDLTAPVLQTTLPVKAQPKERARFSSRSGTAFTPKRTREFETYIADKSTMLMKGRHPVEFPVKVDLTFMETVPKSYTGMKKAAALAGLIFPSVGDVDNKTKAVTDGMNGVVYADDSQIQVINASRKYGPHTVIIVAVYRAGLSQYEVDKIAQKYRPGILGA